jgi:hypothetical protein
MTSYLIFIIYRTLLSNPGWDEIFSTYLDWPCPTSYMIGTGSFPEVNWPGCGVDHPPPSCIKVKERVELYLYSTLCPLMAHYRMNFYLFYRTLLNILYIS